MFTGIIEELGTIERVLRQGGGITLTVRSTGVSVDARIGDSIALNGACLTVTEVGPGTFTVQAVEETLLKSTLGRWQRGDRVNLEAALQPSDRLGGHIVTGHVDGIGIIRSRLARESSIVFSVEYPVELDPYIVNKGSVAADGVSLTVADVLDARMVISVIPHTADVTTLGFRRVGDEVNLEVDLLGKYVEKYMRGRHEPINETWLKKLGY